MWLQAGGRHGVSFLLLRDSSAVCDVSAVSADRAENHDGAKGAEPMTCPACGSGDVKEACCGDTSATCRKCGHRFEGVGSAACPLKREATKEAKMDKCEYPDEFDDRFDDGVAPYVSPYPEEKPEPTECEPEYRPLTDEQLWGE